VEFPDELYKEIVQLGEDVDQFKRMADQYSLDFVRYYLNQLNKTSQLFRKWFPRLEDFEREHRINNPFPSRDQLTETDQIARRILEPKIATAEKVPQKGNFCAAIFTAPLSVLSLVTEHWPSEYANAVFLTPEELHEWNEQYTESDDALWWYCFQNWDLEFDPPSDSFWLNGCEHPIPKDATKIIATWGMSWGSLAGGLTGELWYVENGYECFAGNLATIDF